MCGSYTFLEMGGFFKIASDWELDHLNFDSKMRKLRGLMGSSWTTFKSIRASVGLRAFIRRIEAILENNSENILPME